MPAGSRKRLAHRQPNVLSHRSILVEAVKAQGPASVRIASAAHVAMAAGNERISCHKVAGFRFVVLVRIFSIVSAEFMSSVSGAFARG